MQAVISSVRSHEGTEIARRFMIALNKFIIIIIIIIIYYYSLSVS